MPAIEVRGLTKRFGPVVAVDDLSFTVPAGRVTGFLGPNGAGKTTTLRMLLGLVHATSGTATFDGTPYPDLADPLRRVGAVLEATSFHPGRRAIHHLRMVALGAHLPPERAEEVLELVGLADVARRRVGGFSLGMRQRLELATALLGDPQVLILDEPANGLDPQGILWLRTFLRHQAAAGRAVLISSHLLSEMEETVDEVVILASGRLVMQTTLADLSARAGRHGGMRVRSPEADRLVDVLSGIGATARRVDGEHVVVDGATPQWLGPILAHHQIVCYGLSEERGSLEDVFLTLTAGDGGGSGPGSIGNPR